VWLANDAVMLEFFDFGAEEEVVMPVSQNVMFGKQAIVHPGP